VVFLCGGVVGAGSGDFSGETAEVYPSVVDVDIGIPRVGAFSIFMKADAFEF
jgi:hypothetical protein